jgi:raffinose/stachyose/melibiose transport system permease protein
MKKNTYPFYFAVGALGLYLLLFVIPGIMGILYSFTDWSSYSREINYVGLENFKTVFSPDEHFMSYILNTLRFTGVTVVVKTLLGLAFALLLCEGIKGKDFHRAVIFMPAILSVLITGLIFKSILNPEYGLLNEFLRLIGLGALEQQWLTDVRIALYSIMAVDTWKGMGYIMTILLAGLQSIPRSYYEASDIDGANYWGKLRYVTLPMLMPSITVTTVLNLLHGLKVFDIVYVLTNGGPGYVTEVLYTSVFKEFSLGKYGLGTAVSSVLFIFMIVIGYFVIRLMSREEVDA